MITYRIFKVWRRDMIVWQKYLAASLVTHFGEPLIYLVAMGFGLGRYIEGIGMSYAAFIAPAIVISSMMNGASFETTFSSYTRLETQKTFHGIAMTPVSMEEVVGGEILWATTKSLITSCVIFIVLGLFGLLNSWYIVLMPILMLVVGLLFSSLGMLMTSFARNYDFFSYYFTLFISPMFVFSGTFFPLDKLPTWAKYLAQVLPLTHAVRVARNLFAGQLHWHDVFSTFMMLVAALLIGMISIKRIVRRILV